MFPIKPSFRNSTGEGVGLALATPRPTSHGIQRHDTDRTLQHYSTSRFFQMIGRFPCQKKHCLLLLNHHFKPKATTVKQPLFITTLQLHHSTQYPNRKTKDKIKTGQIIRKKQDTDISDSLIQLWKRPRGKVQSIKIRGVCFRPLFMVGMLEPGLLLVPFTLSPIKVTIVRT